MGFSDNKTAGNLLTTTNKILLDSIDTIDQKKNNDNSSISNYGILSYTEPLTDNWKLQFEYLFENGFNKQDKKTFNRGDGSYSELEVPLSNIFDNSRIQHRLSAIGVFEKKSHVVTGGLGIFAGANSTHLRIPH